MANGIPRPIVKTQQWFLFLCLSSFLLTLSPVFLWVALFISMVTAVYKSPFTPLIKAIYGHRLKVEPHEDRDQQRFNQWLSILMLGIILMASNLGFSSFSYALTFGLLLICSAALYGFCLGCFLRYRYLLWSHKRKTVKKDSSL